MVVSHLIYARTSVIWHMQLSVTWHMPRHAGNITRKSGPVRIKTATARAAGTNIRKVFVFSVPALYLSAKNQYGKAYRAAGGRRLRL